MNVSRWAIKNPIPVGLAMVLLVALGLLGFSKLGVDEWPNADLPLVMVQVAWPGASGDELERQVTKPIEDALAGLPGLEHQRSTLAEGLSTTVLELTVGQDSSQAVQKVQAALDRIRATLPGEIQEPLVLQPNTAGAPFASYVVEAPGLSPLALSHWVDHTVGRRLMAVPGVSAVPREGGLSRELQVLASPQRLLAHGLSLDALTLQLKQSQVRLGSGLWRWGALSSPTRTMAASSDLEALSGQPISLPGGGQVPLRSLGRVVDGAAQVSSLARWNGKPVVAFSVVRAQGAPVVQTAEGVEAAVSELNQAWAPHRHIRLVRSNATLAQSAYRASLDALILGSLLSVVVIFAFLRDWRSTTISALAIPLSILPTFWVMQSWGHSLNGLTLVALTLVVGILVDDAIVDLENIHRHMAMGKGAWAAAFDATDEIGLAVVATTLSIVAVFVPLSFMPGIPGLFFRSFGLTVAVAVLFSLAVARTVTPLLAARWLDRGGHSVHEPERERWYQSRYAELLAWALKRPAWILSGAMCLFVASLALIPWLPKGAFSMGDHGQAVVTLTLPPGARPEASDALGLAVTRLLQQQTEVRSVYATTGTSSGALDQALGGASAGGPNVCTLQVQWVPRQERSLSLNDYVQSTGQALKARVPGARVGVVKVAAGGGAAPEFQMILRSDDAALLSATANQILREARGLKELREVQASHEVTRSEWQIHPKAARMAEAGVSASQLAQSLRLALGEEASERLPKFSQGAEQITIRPRLDPEFLHGEAGLRQLLLTGHSGPRLLGQLADLRLSQSPVSILRHDRRRQITISGNLSQGSLGEAMAAVGQLPALKALPPGVEMDTMGDAKVVQEMFRGFLQAIALALFLLYALLAVLFGSLRQPLTIMGALPLAIGGAFVGLLLTGGALDMMSLIGILMLMGIVCKNAILLVDYTQQARREGAEVHAALLEAGRHRVRPILMTTLAMLAGMLPIALAWGEGTERLQPMGIAVVGGLISSTALTLVVIPVAYALMARWDTAPSLKTGANH